MVDSSEYALLLLNLLPRSLGYPEGLIESYWFHQMELVLDSVQVAVK